MIFLTSGPKSWASARIRCHWPAQHIEGAVVKEITKATMEEVWAHDVVVFQKHSAPELQKKLIAAGKQVYWDACDPMWWFSPKQSRLTCENITGAVVPTQPLADDLRAWHPGVDVTVIPDCLDLDHFPLQRHHRHSDPVRLVWYGIAVNRVALAGAWANLARLKANGLNVELTVMEDRPDMPLPYGNEIPVYYSRWALDKENEVIANHDIALLPPYPGAWGRVKSDNKALTAIACGVPPIDGFEYEPLLELVISAEARVKSAILNLERLSGRESTDAARMWEGLVNV